MASFELGSRLPVSSKAWSDALPLAGEWLFPYFFLMSSKKTRTQRPKKNRQGVCNLICIYPIRKEPIRITETTRTTNTMVFSPVFCQTAPIRPLLLACYVFDD